MSDINIIFNEHNTEYYYVKLDNQDGDGRIVFEMEQGKKVYLEVNDDEC